jgi:hypothetical protein
MYRQQHAYVPDRHNGRRLSYATALPHVLLLDEIQPLLKVGDTHLAATERSIANLCLDVVAYERLEVEKPDVTSYTSSCGAMYLVHLPISFRLESDETRILIGGGSTQISIMVSLTDLPHVRAMA